jgi:hypothetical protein
VAPGRGIGEIIKDSRTKDGLLEPPRVAIHGHLGENKIFLFANPNYMQTISTAARSASERKAWMEGSWDITSGGILDDLWDERVHVIPDISVDKLKSSKWFLNRAFDFGLSHPFVCQWWAESNGEPIDGMGMLKGDLILFDEYYGWTGEDDEGLRISAREIAEEIVRREKEMGLWGRIKKGPADSQIYAPYDGNKSHAGDMAKVAVYWDKADKTSGSRKQGWGQIRKLLTGAMPVQGLREQPGLFICERCAQFRRTVPCLPRSPTDPDDVDTKSEDHEGDACRYRVTWTRRNFILRQW